jgi:hypothetical protein
MRVTADQHAANENRLAATTDLLLRGDIPPGGQYDIKPFACEADVDRTALYGGRPEEFERRLRALDRAGGQPDPRDAQITRLRDEIAQTKERPAESASTISDLTAFRAKALVRLAAQYDEITRLRRHADQAGSVHGLSTRAQSGKPCS